MQRKVFFLGLVLLIVLSPIVFVPKAQAWSGDIPVCTDMGEWDFMTAFRDGGALSYRDFKETSWVVAKNSSNEWVIFNSDYKNSQPRVSFNAATATNRYLTVGSGTQFKRFTDAKVFISASQYTTSANYPTLTCVQTTFRVNYNYGAQYFPEYVFKDETPPVDPNPPNTVVVNVEDPLNPGQKLAVFVAIPAIFATVAYTVYRFGRPRK